MNSTGMDKEIIELSCKINITILMDNITYQRKTYAEHGFSLLMSVAGKRLLFDAGSTDAFLKNADSLGYDIEDTEGLVISHGHYDHTGGIPALLEKTGSLKVYAHPEVFQERYSKGKDGFSSNVGIPWLRAIAQELGAKFQFSSEPQEIMENIFLTGSIPRKCELEVPNERLYVCKDGKTNPDFFLDEQALFIKLHDQIIVITGCAHAGLINTLEYIRELSDDARLFAVIGGTHLMGASEERITKTIRYLKGLSPSFIIPCHCTGLNVIMQLYGAFGQVCEPGKVGYTLRF